MKLHACPGPPETDRDLKKLWAEIAANHLREWYLNPNRSQSFSPDGMPAISAGVRSTLDKLGELFERINNDGDVQLSRANELEITRHLWKYLAAAPSKYLALEPKFRQLRAHLIGAANIMSDISDSSCPADEYLGCIVGLEDELRDQARLVSYEIPRKRKVGAPSVRAKRSTLVDGLARLYRSAGGSVTTTCGEDGKDAWDACWDAFTKRPRSCRLTAGQAICSM